MRLVADGQLRLETPARRFLPSFTGAGKDDVTVEHLLTHTAGLPPWWPLYFEARDRDAALERAQLLPLASRPGTAWCYSDLGLILAGRIVERVTALGLADAFRRLVAEPLGLAARYGPVPAARAAASADSDAYEFGMIATGRPYPVPFTARPVSRLAEPAAARGGQRRQRRARAGRRRGPRRPVRHGRRPAAPWRRPARRRLHPRAGPRPLRGPRRGPSRAGGRLPPGPAPRLGGAALTLLYHGGFTGTYFAFGLEDELVVAGGAMRLYGTLGPIPADGRHPDVSHLVAGADIQSVLLDAAVRGLRAAQVPTPPPPRNYDRDLSRSRPRAGPDHPGPDRHLHDLPRRGGSGPPCQPRRGGRRDRRDRRRVRLGKVHPRRVA